MGGSAPTKAVAIEDPFAQRLIGELIGRDHDEAFHLAPSEVHSSRAGLRQRLGLLLLADARHQLAVLHGADQHVAVEREADAAEHADFATMRMAADRRPDAVGEVVAFGTLFLRRFHSARHYGRDVRPSQFALLKAVERTEQQQLSGPVIILVEPQLGENIGMVARAMANFGLDELRLVNPRDGWPNEKARAAASKADHVIDRATIFADLETAVADLNFVLATTARERDGFKPVLGPVEAARGLRQRLDAGQRAGILFGRERFGLYNEEIARADEIVTFPVNPAFASLNIAQAVLLMAYEWMKSGLESETRTAFTGPGIVPAERKHLTSFLDHLEDALSVRGYFRPAAKKPKMVDNLRAVLTRPGFSEAEIKVLRGVLASLDYFSPDEPRGSGYPGRKSEADSEAHGTDSRAKAPRPAMRKPASPAAGRKEDKR